MILRSLLFVPADSERKLAKGNEVRADALVLDPRTPSTHRGRRLREHSPRIISPCIPRRGNARSGSASTHSILRRRFRICAA
jgi:hypothetical protein